MIFVKENLTFGLLRGVPLQLVVRPIQVNPEGQTTTVYVVHLEARGDDMESIRTQALQRAEYELKNALQVGKAHRQRKAAARQHRIARRIERARRHRLGALKRQRRAAVARRESAEGGLGAYIVFQASRWEYIGNDGPGPGFFPLWYGIAMLGLSLILVVGGFKQSEAIDWTGAGRAFTAWAALVVAIAALKYVGFLIGFAALAFFVGFFMYRRRIGVAAGAAVAAAAVFYVIFPLALGVKLP